MSLILKVPGWISQTEARRLCHWLLGRKKFLRNGMLLCVLVGGYSSTATKRRDNTSQLFSESRETAACQLKKPYTFNRQEWDEGREKLFFSQRTCSVRNTPMCPPLPQWAALTLWIHATFIAFPCADGTFWHCPPAHVIHTGLDEKCFGLLCILCPNGFWQNVSDDYSTAYTIVNVIVQTLIYHWFVELW